MLPLIISAFNWGRHRFRFSLDSLADLGCGSGRFLAELDRRAGRLYGVDRSAEMLALARRRLPRGRAVLIRQDLRALSLPEKVSCMTCNADTVNYVARPGHLDRFVSAVARNLRDGGHLIFDFIGQGAGAGQAKRAQQTLRLGRTTAEMTMTIDPDHRGSTVLIALRSPDGRQHLERHRQFWPHPETVRAALASHGLTLMSLAPVTSGGAPGWLHAVARKTGTTGS